MRSSISFIFILFFITGCSLKRIDVYKVINESSYTVYLWDFDPPADREEVIVRSLFTDSFTIEYNILPVYTLHFKYGPANFVEYELESDKKIIFKNKK
jgi:hypothetical protein